MRKLLTLILAVLLSCTLATAAVTTNNLSLKQEYVPFDFLAGTINITITNENFDAEITSNLGDNSMVLEDWLDANSANYNCIPNDCSVGYETTGAGLEGKQISVSSAKKFFGFVLEGDDVSEIESLSFDIDSDFNEGDRIPLKLKFFESLIWEYKLNSSDYSRDISDGCFGSKIDEVNVKNTRFCSMMNISDTASLMMGANIITGSGSGNVDMIIYSSDTEEDIDQCSFDPTAKDNCIVDNDGLGFQKAVYYICLESDRDETGYKIAREEGNVNNSCGWAQTTSNSFSVGDLESDFDIFIKLPSYADDSKLKQTFSTQMTDCDDETICWEDVLSEANSFFSEKYPTGDCTDDCILPIEVTGTSQPLDISNLSLDYRESDVSTSTNKIYEVDDKPPTVSFEGILDIAKLEFSVGGPGKKKVDLEIASTGITPDKFDNTIEVVNAPIINYVTPTNPPAAVLTTFTVGLNSSATNLTYLWIFGDGDMETTSVDYVQHAYKEIKSYTMTVNITSSGFTSSKSFTIIVGSPKEVVNSTLEQKQKYLNDSKADLVDFDSWLRDELEDAANITYYESELSRIERAISNAFSDADYLKIATDLHNLDVPKSIFVAESLTSPLITDLNDIDLAPVVAIGGGKEVDSSNYANSVLRWQEDYINASIKSEKIAISGSQSGRNIILTVFDISITSDFDQESYFVLKKDYSELYFNEGDPRKSEDSTVVIIDKYSTNNLKFYFNGEDEFPMFASPKVNQLTITHPLDTCDRDGKCETGEDSENCPDDCKPYGRAILYIILVIIGATIIYAILQVWYKTRYEGHLFKDRRHLFNLLMFIDNARAQGMDDNTIKSKLKNKKWTREQLTYALKKSRGESTGMYEIIPIEPLLAWNRRRKAQKRVQAQTTQPKGMLGRGFHHKGDHTNHTHGLKR